MCDWSNIIIQRKCFFHFIGQEPTTCPANNYPQIMVCSCAISSNCVWMQIIFRSCIKETALFSFLWSLLRENGRLLCFLRIFITKKTRWSNDKRIIELGDRKIFRQIILICSPLTNHYILLNLVQWLLSIVPHLNHLVSATVFCH